MTEEQLNIIMNTLFLYLTKRLKDSCKRRFLTYEEYTDFFNKNLPKLPAWSRAKYREIISAVKDYFKNNSDLLQGDDLTPIEKIISDEGIISYLHRAEIYFVEILLDLTYDELFNLKGIGPIKLERINTCLEKNGYRRIEKI